MLKKEHICCKINSGRVKPQLIDPTSAELLEMASSLLAIYHKAEENALSRDELDQLTAPIISGYGESKFLSALNKLLLDRTTFAPGADVDYPAYRRKLFARSADCFSRGELPPPVPQDLPDIYGDLPGFEKITDFKSLSPAALLELYNLAQCQALLIYTSQLKLRFSAPDAAELRKVMKAVKFFRLLADFTKVKRNTVDVTISGPYAIFGPAVKYGISLASLLPVIVNLPKWSLEAVINFRDRELKFKLDEKLALKSQQRSFSSFVPEEIRLYHRHFAEKSSDWQIVGDTPFIDGGNQEIIFPDLSFSSRESGNIIHLELFHRWHTAQLDKRLTLLKDHPELPLILGIDRAVVKEAELDDKLSDFPELRKRCWLFSEFPGVENTLRTLRRVADHFSGEKK